MPNTTTTTRITTTSPPAAAAIRAHFLISLPSQLKDFRGGRQPRAMSEIRSRWEDDRSQGGAHFASSTASAVTEMDPLIAKQGDTATRPASINQGILSLQGLRGLKLQRVLAARSTPSPIRRTVAVATRCTKETIFASSVKRPWGFLENCKSTFSRL